MGMQNIGYFEYRVSKRFNLRQKERCIVHVPEHALEARLPGLARTRPRQVIEKKQLE